jgi:F-type H+-transporting ATPase subunit delta
MSIIAERYAQALFECASEQNTIEHIFQDMAKLDYLAAHSKEFNKFLRRFITPPSISIEVFKSLAKKLSFSDLSLKFLSLLVEQKRIEYLQEIIKQFRKLYLALNNTLEAQISCPQPLTKPQRQTLTKLLNSKVNKNIVLNETVDPKIIGGVIIQIGGYLIDSSIRSQLNKLQKVMRA